MENSRLHSQEPSFRPEPLNQEPRWAIVTYRISLVSGPGGVINSNAHTATLLAGRSASVCDLGREWGVAEPALGVWARAQHRCQARKSLQPFPIRDERAQPERAQLEASGPDS